MSESKGKRSPTRPLPLFAPETSGLAEDQQFQVVTVWGDALRPEPGWYPSLKGAEDSQRIRLASYQSHTGFRAIGIYSRADQTTAWAFDKEVV